MAKKIKRTVITSSDVSLVDNETGEIFNTQKENNNIEKRITIEEFLTEEKETYSHNFMTDITFIKSFRGNGISLYNFLSPIECATILFLSDFICYDDCVLRENGERNKKALSIEELAMMMGLKYDTLRKTMTNLKKKEVIAYFDCGEFKILGKKNKNNKVLTNDTRWIVVNPYIFCRGMKINDFIVSRFENSEWAKIARQKIKNSIYE